MQRNPNLAGYEVGYYGHFDYEQESLFPKRGMARQKAAYDRTD
jgi:hypothetical protein